MQFKGLDDFQKKFQKKIDQDVNGEVSLEVLFNSDFIQRNTNFSNMQEFFDKSPFEIKSQEDFEKLDVSELDGYVQENTKFKSWDEMKKKAGEEYVAKQLKGFFK